MQTLRSSLMKRCAFSSLETQSAFFALISDAEIAVRGLIGLRAAEWTRSGWRQLSGLSR